MDTTKSHGFFLAGFLLFMFLRDLTEACSCGRMSLQKACCRAGFVMRIKFMSFNHSSPSYIYTIQPTEVYKGPGNLRNAQFLYTAESQSYCGYLHKGPLQEDDYVISGSVYGDRPVITKCSFAKPWNKVNDKQKMKLKDLTGKSCSNSCYCHKRHGLRKCLANEKKTKQT